MNQYTEILRGSSFSWRLVLAGLMISFLVHTGLTLMGLGLASASLQGIIEGEEAGRPFFLLTAIWLIASSSIALFFGSYFASRGSGSAVLRRVGAIQGAVISSLFFGFFVFGTGSIAAMLSREAGLVISSMGVSLLSRVLFGTLLIGAISAIFGGIFGAARNSQPPLTRIEAKPAERPTAA